MQASSASSSIQDPSDPAILPAVEPITLGQTEIEPDESLALEALTDFPDVPFERVDLPTVSELPSEPAEPTEHVPPAVLDEAERFDVLRPPPEWCVDQGESMLAMTTFELWMALARGDVDSKTRVWGIGMDSWEVVADIPELSHALADSLSLEPPLAVPTPIAIMSVRGHDRTPLGFGTTDAANDDDGPAQSGPMSRRWKGFSFGRVAFAAGCLAAAAAVGLTVVPRSADMTDAAAAVNGAAVNGANGPMAVARLQSVMERANRQVEEAVQRRLEAEAVRAVLPVAPSARQHKDVGQRRSRRGHR